MELHFSVKSLNKQSSINKTGYILRKDMKNYDTGEHYKCSKSNEDLIFSNTLLVEGMPNNYKNPETLLNALIQDPVAKQTKSIITRDWCANLSNSFIVFNHNGNIDKDKTSQLPKPILDQYFNDNFVNDKSAVIYAVHCSRNKNSNTFNLHVHWESLAYKYENDSFISKSYKNDLGKKQYRNPLDNKYESHLIIQKLRYNLANIQNNKLKEMGIDQTIEYKSYESRIINKIPNIHLEKSRYEELCQLKKKYSYIDDVVLRNKTIIKENFLTKEQIKFLNIESYNNKDTLDNSYYKRILNNAETNHKVNKLGYAARSNLKGIIIKGLFELNQFVEKTNQNANKNNMRGR
ncbi:MAG: MobA/MobL family protein [Erysipelotrichaceae bacterium]|nr:MobA/MobL family protein [Erysipelotrichaceae bacterium]